MVETYRIHVSGLVDDRWSEWFGDLSIARQGDGTTMLVGPVADQPALHGAFALIRDLGLPLLSVNRELAGDGPSHCETRATRSAAANGAKDPIP